MIPRDPEADFQCVDCGRESARLHTVGGRLVCDGGCERSTTVIAIFTHRGDVRRGRVELLFDGRVVRMRGGPTGYESFLIEDWLRYPTLDGGWPANAGGGSYDTCSVPAEEMKRALEELGAVARGAPIA